MKDCAIVALSNPVKKPVDQLVSYLEGAGYTVYVSQFLYFKTDGSLKAEELQKFYDMNVDYIFDVSGGNLSLDSLYHMDFRSVKESDTIFMGYSDLTTILNAIYTITKKQGILYQPRFFLNETPDLDSFNVKYLQGQGLQGTVVGGNVRCLLKLAGTTYFPDMVDKVLFLESNSGDAFVIESYFAQLRLLGVFDKINGLFLGSFTELESNGESISVIASKYFSGPIVKTNDIGHQVDSKMLKIGGYYIF